MMMSELAAMMLSGGEGFYSSLSKMFFFSPNLSVSFIVSSKTILFIAAVISD